MDANVEGNQIDRLIVPATLTESEQSHHRDLEIRVLETAAATITFSYISDDDSSMEADSDENDVTCGKSLQHGDTKFKETKEWNERRNTDLKSSFHDECDKVMKLPDNIPNVDDGLQTNNISGNLSAAAVSSIVTGELSGNQSPSSQRSVASNDSVKPQRFNPFNRDIFMEEDHFAVNSSFNSLSNKTSPQSIQVTNDNDVTGYRYSISSSTDSWSDLSSYMHSKDVDENDVSFADLGLTEDHFSQPEGVFGLSTTEELEMAIENCKELIKEAGDNQQKKNNLVHKLVQLRLRLQEAKEGPEEAPEDWKLVLGHRFRHQDSKSSQRHCERCNTVIWGMLQLWYRCEICGYSCHSKCLNVITRMCAITKVNECPTYCLSICPEKGLDAQQFRCAECRTVISFKESFSEPRQCDYTGDYYCENCHWNDVAIIPARVIHNWDFDQRRVCRASKQFLHLMSKKAVLRIQDMNPMLFSFGDELQEIKRLREQILIMKKYILNCQEALASKLLLQLQDRQHFVDNSDMYSLRDLLDLQGDLLLPSVTKIHASFAQHIKTDCQLCQAKGYICELCDSDEVLFPFDAIATVCPSCSAVLHKHCYIRRGSKCPRCERLARRESMQR